MSDRLMRAAVYRHFGGPEVVAIEVIPVPVPGPNEVLIRVRASTVSAADHRARGRDVPAGLGLLSALALGTRRPRRRVLGMDVAGVVEAVGSEATRFSVGDEVIAMLGVAFGGHAEYAVVRADGAIARKPREASFEEAVALVFGGITAKSFLDQAMIRVGSEVLVIGASGAVGTAAVQLAKHGGARVTGVTSGANRALVASLGAERVVDYTATDVTLEPARYDAIVDCVGAVPFETLERMLAPGGALLHVVADLGTILRAPARARRIGGTVTASVGAYTAEKLEALERLAESGHLAPVIDRTYDLDEIVAAHRYVDTGHKRGSVVLRMPG